MCQSRKLIHRTLYVLLYFPAYVFVFLEPSLQSRKVQLRIGIIRSINITTNSENRNKLLFLKQEKYKVHVYVLTEKLFKRGNGLYLASN